MIIEEVKSEATHVEPLEFNYFKNIGDEWFSVKMNHSLFKVDFEWVTCENLNLKTHILKSTRVKKDQNIF